MGFYYEVKIIAMIEDGYSQSSIAKKISVALISIKRIARQYREHGIKYNDEASLREAITKYINFYNNERFQVKLN